MKKTENENIQKSAGIDQAALEQLAHIFGICLYKINLNTKDISLTHNTTKITGYGFNDLPNNDDTRNSMIYEDDRKLVNRSMDSIISGQRDHYHIEYRMRRRDLSLVWIEEVGIISQYDEKGKPLYISALAIDLSRLKWAEEKARLMEYDVKRLAKSRESTLAEENRLLRAANAAAAMIIGGYHQEYETVLHQAIQMLGESLQANYSCILRNVKYEESQHFFLRTNWTKKANTLGTGKNNTHYKYDDYFPDWKVRMAEGNFIAFEGNKLPKEFVEDFDIANAKRVMLIPIYLHGDFWGMIGFTRDEDIDFYDYEAETIMTGAVIIASSVSRNETFGRINMDRDKAIANTLAKGEFLSRMSHELRTPLNAIIGMTNIALREKDSKKVLEHIKKVESSSQLLLNIINDILDISKIDAGKLELVKESFDFNNMLKNAENIVRVKMDEKKQRFTVHCNEDIKYKIISDEHRLLQVIVNLLNNAMKFTPENGEISLTATQKKIDGSRIKLRVEVSDSGIGITPQQQEKLFRAFEQTDGSITRKYGGTGLGLAICKKILNALGGDIWVKSKPNQGACFFFELDAETGESLELNNNSTSVSAGDGTDATFDWSGYTIILAEDVEINREIVELMLSETGIKIINAVNGKEAVEKFSAEPERYNLILMDIQMPVLDGLSATKYIRSINNAHAKKIPIIAMTANAFTEDVDICLDAGMNEHIAKPISIEHFFDVLKKYL